MFKAQILRRSFSLFNRIPSQHLIRSAARDGHQNIQIQRVRFRRHFFTRSRVLGTTFALFAGYELLRYIDIPLDEEEEEVKRRARRRELRNKVRDVADGEEDDRQEEEEEDRDDEEDSEALLFFPTGFSRAKPRTFYKGSDPEWLEFVRIAPDRKRIERVRGELIGLVRDIAAKNPQYKRRLGNINTKKGAIWVEVKFPDGPPIEYERPGIELTEDLEFRRATRPVHDMHHKRLANLLVPTAVANSVYADSKMRLGKQWQAIKKYFGWGESKQDKNTPMQITVTPTPSSALQEPVPKPPPTTPSKVPASTPPDSETQQQQTPPSAAPSESLDSKQPAAPLEDPFYELKGFKLPSPSAAVTIDLSAFRQTFRKNYKPPWTNVMDDPPRGTFVVSGLIEIIGDKAKMTLDVSAAYDPKIGKFVALAAKTRSIVDYKQKPKGGP
ncbi:hypothetical protein CC78DRAFT_619021 [Lojkania enalia]|uniref:Uncharacterized protein n=1 Tax=Lojkania enalia TaxID=147567 RepID=A0A9P4K5T6_9PLEO|nr:hypothetical protein CC78DRAFT_619021 [Didymosphaeria enalia]